MQNLSVIQRIIHLLAVFRAHTELSTSVSLNDVNITNEDISAILLSKVYGWNLVNLNTLKAPQPAIDLGDKTLGIGVSVTATKTSTYIKDKIDINISNGVYKTYPLHYFFVTTSKSDYTTSFDTKGFYVFDKQKHIIDLEDVIKKIKTLLLEKQSDILALLEQYITPTKVKFVDDIYPQDIARVLNEFSTQNHKLIDEISERIEAHLRTEYPDKNKLNNLSEAYFHYIRNQSLPFFSQLRDFLEKFENRNFKKIYSNIASDLQKTITLKRTEFATFDEIFDLIEKQSVTTVPGLLDDRRILRMLLHFMYFQCDIGEIKK